MKISNKMDLSKLGKLLGPNADMETVTAIRTRLVMVYDGKDTADVAPGDWDKVTRFESTEEILANVRTVFDNFGIKFIHCNKKSCELTHGFRKPAKTGDRSIDASWIFFQVKADSEPVAESIVRQYVTHPKAKFTGMMVSIIAGRAYTGDGKVIDINPNMASN